MSHLYPRQVLLLKKSSSCKSTKIRHGSRFKAEGKTDSRLLTANHAQNTGISPGNDYLPATSPGLLRTVPKIHALHKTRHIADDADNAVLIAVVHADRILTIRPTKIYSKQLRLGSEVGDASV